MTSQILVIIFLITPVFGQQGPNALNETNCEEQIRGQGRGRRKVVEAKCVSDITCIFADSHIEIRWKHPIMTNDLRRYDVVLRVEGKEITRDNLIKTSTGTELNVTVQPMTQYEVRILAITGQISSATYFITSHYCSPTENEAHDPKTSGNWYLLIPTVLAVLGTFTAIGIAIVTMLKRRKRTISIQNAHELLVEDIPTQSNAPTENASLHVYHTIEPEIPGPGCANQSNTLPEDALPVKVTANISKDKNEQPSTSSLSHIDDVSTNEYHIVEPNVTESERRDQPDGAPSVMIMDSITKDGNRISNRYNTVSLEKEAYSRLQFCDKSEKIMKAVDPYDHCKIGNLSSWESI